jgi:chorismate mutase
MAQDAPESELMELRQLLVEQQATIQRLAETQAQMAAEIAELKRGRDLPASAAAVPDQASDEVHADVAGDEPIVAVSFRTKGDEPVAGAATDPSSLLKKPIRTAGKAVSIGAHVNRAVNVVDDGIDTETYFVDNGNYPTLFYLKGYKETAGGWNVGAHLEFAAQSNAATVVSQVDKNVGLDFKPRFFELTFAHQRYGKFWFGRGFMSSFLAVEADKSNTWRHNVMSLGNSFGGIRFIDASTSTLSDVSVGTIFIDAEAFSLRDRVRYDSPIWSGFQASASVGSGVSGDVTLRYNRMLGNVALFAGGSVQRETEISRIEDRASFGIGLFDSRTGLNFSVLTSRLKYDRAYLEQLNRTDDKSSGWVARGGIRRNWFGPGETRFAVDYGTGGDLLFAADNAESYGLFVSQVVDELNLEFYAGYRYYDYDAGPNSNGLVLKDVNAFTVGASIGFDATVSE